MIELSAEGFISNLPIEAEAAAYRSKLSKIKEQWKEIVMKIRAEEK